MGERMFKRGNVWWCRVRNRAGRVVRKSTKCRDYQAALIVAADLERAAANPHHAAAEETTINRCVEDYLADLVRRGRATATQEIAQQKTGHLLRLWGSSLAMARVNARLVTEYVDTRLREGTGPYTVKKELGHLRQILILARHHGSFHLAPEQVLPPFFVGGYRPRKRFPTPEELERLLLQLHDWRAAFVLFIVATGARLSEALRARRIDVDYANNVVHIRGMKTEGSDDDVPITAITKPLLERALEMAPGKDVLFHPWGKVNRDLAAACVRADIDKCSPNDFRRAFGKWHRLAGVEIDLVSKMLRHTTDKLAQTTYAKVTGGEVALLVERQLDVSNLYRDGAFEVVQPLAMRDETAEKLARPAGLEPATRGLEGRKPNRRSEGTKLGLARAREQGGVSDLYAGDPWLDPALVAGFRTPDLRGVAGMLAGIVRAA